MISIHCWVLTCPIHCVEISQSQAACGLIANMRMRFLNHIELLIVLFHVCAQAGQLFNRIYDLCLLSKRTAAADHVITRRTTATQQIYCFDSSRYAFILLCSFPQSLTCCVPIQCKISNMKSCLTMQVDNHVLRLQECAGRLLTLVDVLHWYQQADLKGMHRQSRRT